MKIRTFLILKYSAVWIALLLMSCTYGHASSVREVSLNEMIQKSQFVFEGTVTAIEARENSKKRIHTYVTFEISDVIKGEYPRKIITLRFVGGTVGVVTMAVSDMRLPKEGEHGIYFVESLERLQVHPLYGWSQGHFIVERDATGIERVMTNRRLPIKVVTDKVHDEQHALSKGVVRDFVIEKDKKGLTVDEFKRVLRERMARK
ncbi:MAG: hypothetical protein CVU51_03140 [Deltaproteobacteria bacterium HGW-Deltaproteobacteria-1]|jgi:hypothetical protein|nr:MAG: hypothetical protein CVU51_03140 [Deltaproteobacteria bacterium HGW-Deltaproteobacteria-1]